MTACRVGAGSPVHRACSAGGRLISHEMTSRLPECLRPCRFVLASGLGISGFVIPADRSMIAHSRLVRLFDFDPNRLVRLVKEMEG